MAMRADEAVGLLQSMFGADKTYYDFVIGSTLFICDLHTNLGHT